MKNFAQDPIDFIRHFCFGIFHSNTGSSKTPTRTDQNLVIRLMDAEDCGVIEVAIPHANHRAAKHVAAWLEKQPFYVFPLAEFVPGESTTWINLKIAGSHISFGSLKVQLEALIGHVAMIDQTMRSPERAKIIPPRANVDATRTSGYAQPPTLGRQQPFENRTPAPGQDNRTPQYWNQSGSTNNNDNW